MSKRRLAVWLLLAVSSLPLHLLYNSVVFQTTATNAVDMTMINESFLSTRGGWKLEDGDDEYRPHFQALQDTFLEKQNLSATPFQNISATVCIHRYQTAFIRAGNGFPVMATNYSEETGGAIGNSSLLAYGMNITEMWFGPKFVSHLLYCLSEYSPERCQVQLNQSILYIVIACNILTTTLMLMILGWMNDETIVTVGDAIQTFILTPDISTQDCCLMTIHDKISEARRLYHHQPGNNVRWYSVVSGKRWFCLLFVYSMIIATALYFYSSIDRRWVTCTDPGASEFKVDQICRWNGFGNVSFRFILDVYLGSKSLIPYVLVANAPQVVISLVYITYNGLFTTMLANREWASYVHKRAALRVTFPASTQRSTYFLSLPYKFSLPLIVASILLHWFISQTLFIAPIAVYKNGVLEPTLRDWFHHEGASGSLTGLGFSDSALLAAIIMGCLLVAACLTIAGFCKYPTDMPLGGTNSAVISAACHIKHRYGGKVEGLDDVVERPLKWGVTIEGTKDQVGHCSFSDKAVQKPVEGCLYA
ncbi:hypothetical protein BKA58DRAFT_448150 [Alternaria rosae]|uniref:uncharacterized protein n=1 Tax=Alternaria rosae TaxID=1187941 RepID=UPI001E8D463D|nr:uncharacterized protein BKA58DRAFT_448150 [Alternaria rosae]KAH6883374.1 hypothetical protein BKA58DRAFT_448150 [Alternaria rosae]